MFVFDTEWISILYFFFEPYSTLCPLSATYSFPAPDLVFGPKFQWDPYQIETLVPR